ncbi:MAG: glycoside hydrolase family 3 C-terminal domain-containing protein, partial [Verrucomicrobia bacterium]|nr:glycoside hydrolase family 3 C-terminal domain-containing protein [Verrucomicrobiota bacterium]
MTARDEEDQRIEQILKALSLEQKVGQCFTYLWSGHLLSPAVIEAIEKLHCGGLRLQPAFVAGKRHQYYDFDTAAGGYDYPAGYEPIAENLLAPGVMGGIAPEAYAEKINRLQAIATARPGGIPLHMVIDQEGDLSRNFPFAGINLFPSAMGQVASADPDFVYAINRAVGRQLSAMGVNWIHSPVLDVNINPDNPEIGIRSYGDDPETVARYGIAAMKGMQDGGLITTAKHFPGRGDSCSDAHMGTPVLGVSRARLETVELFPFRHAIASGVDCIMIAHNVYTALDPDVIATVSTRIVTDLLRGELGFDGVITTDAIAMQALMQQYPLPEACARALQAGADLVLNKTETAYRDQGFHETLKFVQDGRIDERDIDDKVRRILRAKLRRGLLDGGAQKDASQAAGPMREPETITLSQEAARRAIIVMRDEASLLPLRADQRILVVEQKLQDVFLGLDHHSHRLCFTEAMMTHGAHVQAADTDFRASDADADIVLGAAARADVVVMSSDYCRSEESNIELVRRVIAIGKPVVLVTNTPYPMAVPDDATTVVCTFSASPESQRVAAAVLFGKEDAGGQWPIQWRASSFL